MNTKRRRPSYGVLKFSREIAQRLREEWQVVESPRRTAPSHSVVVPMFPPEDPRLPPAVAQALAA